MSKVRAEKPSSEMWKVLHFCSHWSIWQCLAFVILNLFWGHASLWHPWLPSFNRTFHLMHNLYAYFSFKYIDVCWDRNIQASAVMLVCLLNFNTLLTDSFFSGCRFNYCLCTMLHIKFMCRTFNWHPCMYEWNECKNSTFFLIKGLRFPELSCYVIFYYCRCSIAGINSVWMMLTPLLYSFCIILWVCAVNSVTSY